MNKLAFAIAVLIIGLCTYLLYPTRTVIYRDEKVSVVQADSILTNLSPHTSSPKYLNIFGKSFGPIRGMPPYYLEAKSIHAILFVTESGGGDVTFILAFEQTKQIVKIPAGKTGFGWDIGSGRADGEALTDYIESADMEHIIVTTHGIDWKESIILNIAQKSIQRGATCCGPN